MIKYIIDLIKVKDNLSMNMTKEVKDVPLGQNIKNTLSEQYDESLYFLDNNENIEVSNNKSKNKKLRKKQKLKDIKIKQTELTNMRNEDFDVDINLKLIKKQELDKMSIDDSFFIFKGELQDTFWNEELESEYY